MCDRSWFRTLNDHLLFLALQLLEYNGHLGAQIRLPLAIRLLQRLVHLPLVVVVLVHCLLSLVSVLLLLVLRLLLVLLDLVEDRLCSLEVVRPRLLHFAIRIGRYRARGRFDRVASRSGRRRLTLLNFS
ncbi:hypothetical protein PFISCL1PPCAC_9468, partial [Pristionchus fissidentatus]